MQLRRYRRLNLSGVLFIMGAAFVMLALEKARHGENWQPFAWNSFAVLMVVVLVEGMSALFLSTTATTPSASPRP